MSKTDQQNTLVQIVTELLKDELSQVDIARRFNTSRQYIGHVKKKMSEGWKITIGERREEVQERRQNIAEAIKSGKTKQEVCEIFKVSLSTIQLSCEENDVFCPSRSPTHINLVSIVVKILKTKLSNIEIGELYNVNRGTISSIRSQLRRHGLE